MTTDRITHDEHDTGMTPMTTHDLDAWLGDATATPAQREELLAADAALSDIIHDGGEPDTGHAEFTGAARLILGDATVPELGRALLDARIAERDAMSELRGAVVAAHLRGVSQAELRRQTGLARDTIRGMLGL